MRIEFKIELDCIDEEGNVNDELRMQIIDVVAHEVSVCLSNRNYIDNIANRVTDSVTSKVIKELMPVIIEKVEKSIGDEQSINKMANKIMKQALGAKLK